MKYFVIALLLLLPLSVQAQWLTSLDKDIAYGKQTAAEIAANPDKFPILPEAKYPQAYVHVRRILNNILQSPAIQYKDKFAYQDIKIIHDDKTLNAFATPGGHIYVYTGLIKYLDNETQLAGVLGHEIAHAERRHSVKQMEKNAGIGLLSTAVLIGTGTAGSQGAQQLANVANNLLGLKFSRGDENDADKYSVIYLSGTEYGCNGAAGFFEKIQKSGQSGGAAFLSTHPSPRNRVRDINREAAKRGCSLPTPTGKADARYQEFKDSLPK